MPIENKPGEPEFKLKIDPADKLVIKYKMSDKPVESILQITNTTKDRVCYKVKCTDNEIFRVRPPLGFIKPGETFFVKIVLNPQEKIDPTRHYLAIYHVSCGEEKVKKGGKEDPKAYWTPDTKPDGILRMQTQLDCIDEVGDVKKDNKMEEKKEE